MKRCPQCEFIYEDDQSHCDMDGMRLCHESQPLPKLQALITATEQAEKPKWRNRNVTLSASLVLACVLALVSLTSMRRQGDRETIPPIPILIETPSTGTAISTSATSETLTSEETSIENEVIDGPEASDPERPDKAESTQSEVSESVARPNVKRQNVVRPSRSATPSSVGSTKQNEKEDSKVRSAIKKTGRFFKKALPL